LFVICIRRKIRDNQKSLSFSDPTFAVALLAGVITGNPVLAVAAAPDPVLQWIEIMTTLRSLRIPVPW
jgi:hypothetical protein